MKLKMILGIILMLDTGYSIAVGASPDAVHYGDFTNDVHFIDEAGQNSLIYAVTKLAPIEHILKEKPYVNLQDRWGKSALIYAAGRFNLRDLRRLIAAGAKLDLQDLEGKSALIQAFQNKGDDIAIELIKRKANLNLQDLEGKTALMHGIINSPTRGLNRGVKQLVESGANLNLQDRKGRTALMYATARHQQEVVDLLLEAGANANLRNHNNKRAWDIAHGLQFNSIAFSLAPYTRASFSEGLRSIKGMFARK